MSSRLFRFLFLSVTGFLLLITMVTFYRFGSSPTDENWFKNPPSLIYVTAPVPMPDGTNPIQTGDLITSINEMKVVFKDDLDAKLLESGKVLTVEIHRPTLDKRFTYNGVNGLDLQPRWRGVDPVAHVFDVTTGGASDRAGMKVGDLITTINGKTFKDVNEADLHLRQAQSGKTIEYEVLRDNQIITLHVTLANFGFPFALLLFVVCGMVFFGTGAFIALRRPETKGARLVGLYLLTMGFVIMATLIQRDPFPDWISIARGALISLCFFFSFAFFLHSTHYFPVERPDLIRRKWICFTGYGLALACTVSLPWANGVVSILLLIFGMVALVAGVMFFYRKGASSEYKMMSAPLRNGVLIAAIMTGIVIFLVAFANIFISFQNFGFAGIFLVFVPLSYLYTIGKFRLLNLDIRMRRNVQYYFASTGWALLAIAGLIWGLGQLPRAVSDVPTIRLTGASIEVLDETAGSDERQVFEKSVLMILGGVCLFVAWRLGRRVQGVIVRKFHREQYDYRRAGAELAEVMSKRLDMQTLAKGTTEKITSLMHLKRTGVMFFRGQHQCCLESHGFDGASWKNFCVENEGEIVGAFSAFTREFRVSELKEPLKTKLVAHEFQYVIPIRSKEKLIGALLVGEKRSESPFQREDLEFLGAAAKQASVAIENAFLYEELAEQERMKHELEIARRIQMASLPQTTPKIQGLDISGVSIPALEVGGDYYDFLNGDPNRLNVIVGDVSGKGTSAALYMSKVQGIMRSLHGFGLSPHELFVRTNTLLCQDMEKKSFVTAMGAFFKPEVREIILARAGHSPLFHYRHDSGLVQQVIPRRLGLGLNADGRFSEELEEQTLCYGQGDVFLFVTDGVTEAQRNGGEQFGEERLEHLLKTNFSLSAEHLRDRLVANLKEFAGNAHQHDDQTIVVVKAV